MTQQQRDDEFLAIERMEKAHQRSQAAHMALSNEFLPRGNGVLSQEALDEHEAAEAEVHAARADLDRMAAEIVSGKRR
jgi:hypothetical protein